MIRWRDVRRCPSLAELIYASEGDQPWTTHLRMLAHRWTCAACRTQWRELERLTSDAALIRAGTTDRILPSHARFPRPFDVHAGLVDVRRRAHAAEQRRAPRTPALSPLRWGSVAAMLVLLVASLMLSRTGVAVLQADELLRRAALQEQAQPRNLAQRVTIRFTPELTSRAAAGTAAAAPRRIALQRELTQDASTEGWRAADVTASADAAFLEGLFAQQHLDLEHPLSVAQFQAWRASLTRKTDHVSTTYDMALSLRTTTPDGALRTVELVMRRETFEVIRESLVFDGVGRVEIDVVSQWVRTSPPPLPSTSPIVASSSAAVMPLTVVDADALEQRELDARLTLRDLDVDLSQSVRVSRTGATVRVEGVLEDAAKERMARTRLMALSPQHVRVDFRVEPAAAVAAHSAGPGLSRWLARAYGEENEEQALFVPRLERLVSTVNHRLAALSELSSRYPETTRRTLSPAARAKLQRLLDLHYRALTSDVSALNRRLTVLFGPSQSVRTQALQTAPPDWPRRTALARQEASRLEPLVEDLRSHEDLPSETERAALGTAFSNLWTAVNGPISAAAGATEPQP